MTAARRIVLASAVGDPGDSHTLLYARTLRDAGHEVVLMRPAPPGSASPLPGVTLDALPPVRFNFWLYRPGLAHLARAVTQRIVNSARLARRVAAARPDVVVTTEPDAWAAVVLARALGRGRFRVVEDLREVYEDRARAFPAPLDRLVARAVRGLQRALSARTDAIVHMSPERQAYFAYLAQPGTVVQYAPALHAAPWRDLPPHPARPAGAGPLVAIHAGSLRHNYAADVLVRAAELLAARDVPVVIEVLGGTAHRLETQAELEALVAAGRVRLVPPLPFDQVVTRLRQADIGLNLVLPIDVLHRLAQPRKLFEYFAAGLPVVVSDVPTLRRIVGERALGLVVAPEDPVALADAIERLVRDDALRAACASRAQAAAVSEYNWEAQVPGFLAAVTG